MQNDTIQPADEGSGFKEMTPVQLELFPKSNDAFNVAALKAWLARIKELDAMKERMKNN
jgi:hypothetical protein